MNCPFLTLIAFPVSQAALNISVCLHKNAGICKKSTYFAASSASAGICISVIVGRLNSFETVFNISSPFFIPKPLKEFREVLFALS